MFDCGFQLTELVSKSNNYVYMNYAYRIYIVGYFPEVQIFPNGEI